jgi:hypothetical protein
VAVLQNTDEDSVASIEMEAEASIWLVVAEPARQALIWLGVIVADEQVEPAELAVMRLDAKSVVMQLAVKGVQPKSVLDAEGKMARMIVEDLDQLVQNEKVRDWYQCQCDLLFDHASLFVLDELQQAPVYEAPDLQPYAFDLSTNAYGNAPAEGLRSFQEDQTNHAYRDGHE